jgi:hypothetical protein
MSSFEARHSISSGRGLHLVLLLLILWDVLALLAELTFGGPFFKISDDQVGGVLAARGSLGGAAVVPIGLYIYAMARGPTRHRNILWVAALEQGAGALFAVYHVAVSDIEVEGVILPLAVCATLLVLVLVNMPRSQSVV